jgi:hypothetical protein
MRCRRHAPDRPRATLVPDRHSARPRSGVTGPPGSPARAPGSRAGRSTPHEGLGGPFGVINSRRLALNVRSVRRDGPSIRAPRRRSVRSLDSGEYGSSVPAFCVLSRTRIGRSGTASADRGVGGRAMNRCERDRLPVDARSACLMRGTDRAPASAPAGYGIGRRAAPRRSQRQQWLARERPPPYLAVGPHIGDALRWRSK